MTLFKNLREPVNFFTHFIPAILALPAGYYLFTLSSSRLEWFAASVYSIAVVALFTVSAVYHGFPKSTYSIRFWQKFDHCCIYLMIAGSFTPTALLVFEGWLRWALFGVVWLIALAGCLLKILNRLKNTRLSVLVYILMGCLILPFLQKMWAVLPTVAILWLVFGGVLYVGGTYFYAKDKPLHKYIHSHELWHLFVIAGALSHFMYNAVYIFNIT